ncbi:hypothetical protein H8B19_17595 [Neptunicella marina]|uniref:YtxH domain-containing protein n=2 Tax=Neptunicella marina TaxID=2125989 RepID=A0A8J6J0C8_9ALTE|nr:hypothetical protein [Neptunicella marina]MBC3767697.1 hypothetical protein [Neptunicella marina]
MTMFKKFIAMMFITVSATALTACGDGEAEKAGEKVDEMVTDAGNAVEDACEEVKEGVDAKDKDC